MSDKLYVGNPLNALQIRLARSNVPLLAQALKNSNEIPAPTLQSSKKPPTVPHGAKSLSQFRRTCGAAECLTCGKPISQNKKFCAAHALEEEENKASEIDVLQRMVKLQNR